MAGANGIYKFARVNREGQFDSLQTRGIHFHQTDFVTITTLPPGPITATDFLNDMLFPNGGTFTGPTAAELLAVFAQFGNPAIGNEFCQTIENASLVTPLVINPGAGVTGLVQMPVNSTAEVCWEITSINPPLIAMSSFTLLTSGGVPVTTTLPPGLVPGDLLEWDGTQWTVSSAISNVISGILGSLVALPQFTDTLQMGARQYYLNGTFSPAWVPTVPPGQGDSTFRLDITEFDDTYQAGIRVVNRGLAYPVDYVNPLLLGSSNFTSNFLVPSAGVANPVPPNAMADIYHYIGLNGLLTAAPQMTFGASGSGQVFAYSYNLLSGADAKKNIERVEMDSKVIRELLPSRFNYKTEEDATPKTVGMIAEEVEKVFPGVLVKAPKQAGAYFNLGVFVSYLAGVVKDMEQRQTESEHQIQALKQGAAQQAREIELLQASLAELQH